MSTEVEETLKRVQSHKGWKALYHDADGINIKSTLPDVETENYCALVSQLSMKASGVVHLRE